VWGEGEGGGLGSAGEGDLELVRIRVRVRVRVRVRASDLELAEAHEGVADVAHDLEAHLAPGGGDLVEGHAVPG